MSCCICCRGDERGCRRRGCCRCHWYDSWPYGGDILKELAATEEKKQLEGKNTS